MPQTIKAEQRILRDIFGGDYQFIIPPYQRPYSWEERQVDELFDDLDTAINRDFRNIEDMPPYFLGSIVLIKESETNTKADVVDGQQRLTTLTILFSVLRALSDEEEKGLINRYVLTVADKYAGTKEGFRLRLRDQDRAFFEKYIQKGGSIEELLNQDTANLPEDSQRHICENTRSLWNKLGSYSQRRRNLLMQFLVQRCYLVVVSASDRDSAYRIFSVMNARGLDLSPTDILKAEIIGSIPESDRKNYNTKWERIEGDLGRDDFRDLFAHIRMMYVKDKQRETLNREFKDHVLKEFEGKESKFIDDVLLPYSEAYEIISKANYLSSENAEDVNKYLRHLIRLDNNNWMPPAIALFHKHKSDRKGLFKFARDLERLAYALFIRRANINERIGRYARVLESIEEDQDLFVGDSPLQLRMDEKKDVRDRLDEPIYTVTRVRMPLLLRLDSLLAGEGATHNRPVISIEHVLPQTPQQSSQWIKWFPDEGEREYWVHRLANLVLLSRRRNISASNYDFDHKKKKYFGEGNVAPFPLTIEVQQEPEWTPKVLERRQRYLCETLAKEWRL